MGLSVAAGDLCCLRNGGADLKLRQQLEGFADGHGAHSAGVAGTLVCEETLSENTGNRDQGIGNRRPGSGQTLPFKGSIGGLRYIG